MQPWKYSPSENINKCLSDLGYILFLLSHSLILLSMRKYITLQNAVIFRLKSFRCDFTVSLSIFVRDPHIIFFSFIKKMCLCVSCTLWIIFLLFVSSLTFLIILSLSLSLLLCRCYSFSACLRLSSNTFHWKMHSNILKFHLHCSNAEREIVKVFASLLTCEILRRRWWDNYFSW